MEWYGIHQPVHGIHLESPWNPSASTLHSMDSIWNNPGRVKYWVSWVGIVGGGGGWGRRRLLGRPWYTEYIEVILLSFNGCLVQVLECSLIHAHDVLWSWVILDTIFDNKYCGIFQMEFQRNPCGLVPWNPRWICPNSIWNPVESMWNRVGFHMELTIPWPFHMEYLMDSIWNNPGKVKTSNFVVSKYFINASPRIMHFVQLVGWDYKAALAICSLVTIWSHLAWPSLSHFHHHHHHALTPPRTFYNVSSLPLSSTTILSAHCHVTTRMMPPMNGIPRTANERQRPCHHM